MFIMVIMMTSSGAAQVRRSWYVYVDYVYHEDEPGSNIGENSALTTKSLKAVLWSQGKFHTGRRFVWVHWWGGDERICDAMVCTKHQRIAPSTSAKHQAHCKSPSTSAKPSWRRNSHALTSHSVCCREWTLHQDQTSSLQKWQWIFFQWAHMLI